MCKASASAVLQSGGLDWSRCVWPPFAHESRTVDGSTRSPHPHSHRVHLLLRLSYVQYVSTSSQLNYLVPNIDTGFSFLLLLADYCRISGSMHTNFLPMPFLASRERLCSDHQCYLEDATTNSIYIYRCSSLKAVDTKWRDMESEHRKRKKAPPTSEYHQVPWSCPRRNQSFIILERFQEGGDWLHKDETCHMEELLSTC